MEEQKIVNNQLHTTLPMAEMIALLEKSNNAILEREKELRDNAEELEAQKEELIAAVDKLILQNEFLNKTLEDLKERNEELDQLVYKTYHDLRSPVCSTLGLLELLKREATSPAIKEYSYHIGLSMQQMNAILFSISQFTNASLETISIKSIDLKELVQNVILSFSETLQSEKVKIIDSIPDDLTLFSDATFITKILKALIDNSIKYKTREDAYIKITAIRLNDKVQITVDDNGDGMSEDTALQAFNIFYRGNEKSKGAGLGLYIARKMISKLEGSITIEPSNLGARVKILLPLKM